MKFKQSFTSEIIILFLTSRAIFLLFAILAALILGLKEGYLGKQFDHSAPYLVWIWANFDGRHYLDIATLGYRNYNFAFFPLYSSIISLVGYLFKLPHIYIGIAVSTLSYFCSMFVIYKIARLDYSDEVSKLALFFLSFFPVSFFYNSVYPDALFLLETVLCFYFARKKNWVAAGLMGGLTTLTRLSGISLLPALVIEWYLQNKVNTRGYLNWLTAFFKEGLPLIFLTMLGILAYMAYLKIGFGDWTLYQKSMIAWRQNEFVFPPQVIFRYIKILLFVDKSLLVYWIALVELVSFVAYMTLAVYVLRRVRVSYGVFMIVLLLLVSFTGTLAGTTRYMLHLFPGFIGIAYFAVNRPVFKTTLAIFFFVAGFVLLALFTRGYFIS